MCPSSGPSRTSRPRAFREVMVKPSASSRLAARASVWKSAEVIAAMWRTYEGGSSSTLVVPALGRLRNLVLARRLGQALDELRHVGLLDNQRRQHAHDIVAGGDGE